MATRYSKTDGDLVQAQGRKAIKRPNPVWLLRSPEEFEVDTHEGVVKGGPGCYLAYDPISGHVWPVSDEYVGQHYDFVESEDED